jgi:hypothetical protein
MKPGSLSNPKNLEIITPDSMGFKTISGDDRAFPKGNSGALKWKIS